MAEFDPTSITFNFDPRNPAHMAAKAGFLAMAAELGITHFEPELPAQEPQPGEFLPPAGDTKLSIGFLANTSNELYQTDLYGHNASVALAHLRATANQQQQGKKASVKLATSHDLHEFLSEKGLNYTSCTATLAEL